MASVYREASRLYRLQRGLERIIELIHASSITCEPDSVVIVLRHIKRGIFTLKFTRNTSPFFAVGSVI